MPVSPSDKSHGTQAVHQCANKSSAHVDDNKCDDTGTPGSEQNVARKPEVSKQHHSPLAGKSNKGSRAFRPRLDQGVATGTLPVQQHHQQHHLHSHLQQQHIVHCQFHRPCIANLQYGDGAAAAFAHPLHQHAYPVGFSLCGVAEPGSQSVSSTTTAGTTTSSAQSRETILTDRQTLTAEQKRIGCYSRNAGLQLH